MWRKEASVHHGSHLRAEERWVLSRSPKSPWEQRLVLGWSNLMLQKASLCSVGYLIICKAVLDTKPAPERSLWGSEHLLGSVVFKWNHFKTTCWSGNFLFFMFWSPKTFSWVLICEWGQLNEIVLMVLKKNQNQHFLSLFSFSMLF